ncbi:hypothetical protein V496_09432 [Pseudogymnoascus sp. VKM F-4515 (FW-2607)]|nr:hypothetical protein V496_09432 [Pseudogymnoascus sp. VKM F-4515 (FW-2607)]
MDVTVTRKEVQEVKTVCVAVHELCLLVGFQNCPDSTNKERHREKIQDPVFLSSAVVTSLYLINLSIIYQSKAENVWQWEGADL